MAIQKVNINYLGQQYSFSAESDLQKFRAYNLSTGVELKDSSILSELYAANRAILFVESVFSGPDIGLLGSRDSLQEAITQLELVGLLDRSASYISDIGSLGVSFLISPNKLALAVDLAKLAATYTSDQVTAGIYFNLLDDTYKMADSSAVAAYQQFRAIERSGSSSIFDFDQVMDMASQAVSAANYLQKGSELVASSDLLKGSFWSDLASFVTDFFVGISSSVLGSLGISNIMGNIVSGVSNLDWFGDKVGSGLVAADYYAAYLDDTRLIDETTLGSLSPESLAQYIVDFAIQHSPNQESLTEGNDNVFTGGGDDIIHGLAGNDIIDGGTGSDQLWGNQGDDKLYGGSGDDTLSGGANNDILDGGDGLDTAIFSGPSNNYSIASGASLTNFRIFDTVGNEAMDTLYNIEYLQFAGGPKISVADYLDGFIEQEVPPPPPPVEPPAPIVDDYGDTQAGAVSFGASPINGYSSISGEVEVVGDKDMFKVTLTAGVTYSFFLSASSGGANSFDPFLKLTSPNGSTVVNDDVGATTLSAFISITAQQSGTYFLEASGAASSIGNYFLIATKIVTDNTAETLTPTSQPNDPAAPSYWDWQGDSGNNTFPTPSWDPYKGDLSAANTLRGHDGNDRIKAGGGNDVVWGDSGDDRLYGESGNDVLRGGFGDDRLFGDTGRDELFGERGDDFLSGGNGDDYLYGGRDNDRLSGGDGNDYLKGERGIDDLNGGDGDDELYGDQGDDELDGGAGNDLLFGGFGNDQLRGRSGQDRLAGEDGNDLLVGGAGDDLLYGGDDSDILMGGAGNDLLHGERGIDTADFSDGQDGVTVNLFDEIAVSDDLGRDILYGIENVTGSGGDDVIDGDHGINVLFGGDGQDMIRGHDGNDEIDGGRDDDVVWGDTGNDTVRGGQGDDEVRGGLGNDMLFGDDGIDELRGEQGDDTLDGGAGIDTAFFWGERADFSATRISPSVVQIADTRTTGQEGTDTLQNIEYVKFFDGTMAIGDLFVSDATAVDDEAYTGAQKPIVIDVLANDLDFGASTTSLVSVTLVSGNGRVYIADNKVIYDPDGGYDGLVDGDLETVVIEYQMTTSALFSDTGTLSIEVTRTGERIITLVGNADGNLLEGQTLSDNLSGGGGSDAIFGYAGDDLLDGGDGNDTLNGGAGNDKMQGGLGNDIIFDGLGNDFVDGGAGHDRVILLSGYNEFGGSSGNDLLIGGIQGDVILGGSGNDLIKGDVGVGAFGGADIIAGGAGNDIMMGGVGADMFVFAPNDGSDIIADFDVAGVSFDAINGYAASPTGADFEAGVDQVFLNGFATVNAANVMGFITNTAQGAVFSAEGTDITFYGIDPASLTASDFLFL